MSTSSLVLWTSKEKPFFDKLIIFHCYIFLFSLYLVGPRNDWERRFIWLARTVPNTETSGLVRVVRALTAGLLTVMITEVSFTPISSAGFWLQNIPWVGLLYLVFFINILPVRSWNKICFNFLQSYNWNLFYWISYILFHLWSLLPGYPALRCSLRLNYK